MSKNLLNMTAVPNKKFAQKKKRGKLFYALLAFGTFTLIGIVKVFQWTFLLVKAFPVLLWILIPLITIPIILFVIKKVNKKRTEAQKTPTQNS